MNHPSRNRRYLTIGALVYAFVSAVWVVIAYFAGQIDNLLILAVAVPMIAILVVAAIVMLGQPSAKTDATSSATMGKWFGLIFAAEGIGIGVSSGILAGLGLMQWIAPVVAVIVGLHFLPLGRLLRLPLDYFLGLAIVSFVGLVILLAPAANWPMLLGLGTAVLLWMAGWGRLWVARSTPQLS